MFGFVIEFIFLFFVQLFAIEFLRFVAKRQQLNGLRVSKVHVLAASGTHCHTNPVEIKDVIVPFIRPVRCCVHPSVDATDWLCDQLLDWLANEWVG